MYWIWILLFASQPLFLLLGMTGVMGEEAKKAADDVAESFAILLGLAAFAVIGVLIYLKLSGWVTP